MWLCENRPDGLAEQHWLAPAHEVTEEQEYVAVSRWVAPVRGRVEGRNEAARTAGRRPEASPDDRPLSGQGTPAAGTRPVSGRTGANGPERLPPRTWQAARRWTRRRPARLAAGLAPAVLPFSAAAGELRITVDGIRSPHGTVLIGLYDGAASFQKAVEASAEEGFLVDPDRFAAVALRANAALRSAVVFGNLAPGRYAATAFHDENGNGKLDKSFLGVPTEPYGFSNDAQGFLGPPAFDAAAVTIGEGGKAIRIALVYHGGSR